MATAMVKRRRFTVAFKAREALGDQGTVRAMAAMHGVHPNQVSQWKRKAPDRLEGVFAPGAAKARRQRAAEIEALHTKIGQLAVERDSSRTALGC